MHTWAIRVYNSTTPVTVEAYTLVEAVAKAVRYAKNHKIPTDHILAIEFSKEGYL